MLAQYTCSMEISPENYYIVLKFASMISNKFNPIFQKLFYKTIKIKMWDKPGLPKADNAVF